MTTNSNPAQIRAIFEKYPFLRRLLGDPILVNSLRIQRIDMALIQRSAEKKADRHGYERSIHFLILDKEGNLLWTVGEEYHFARDVCSRTPWIFRWLPLRFRPHFFKKEFARRQTRDLSIIDLLLLVPSMRRAHFILEMKIERSTYDCRSDRDVILHLPPQRITSIQMWLDMELDRGRERLAVQLRSLEEV